MLTFLLRAPGMRLVRVRGIAVEAHWSVAILVVSYAGVFARTRFLGRYPGLPDMTISAMTLVSVFLLLVSVVLHEFGHALRARREGGHAERITLWALGGVAWVQDLHSPGATFRMVAAGPMVTAILAPLFATIGVLGQAAGLPHPVVGVTILLAELNAAMLVFNLVPIFPLDGGRMLYALLWRLRGPAFAWLWTLRFAVALASLVLALGAAVPLVVSVPVVDGIDPGLSVMVAGVILLWQSMRFRPAGTPPGTGPRPLMVGDMVEAAATGPAPAPGTTIAEFVAQHPRGAWYGTAAWTVLEDERDVGSISPGLAYQTPADRRQTTIVAEVMVRKKDAIVLSRETPLEQAFHTLNSGSGRGVVLDGRRVTAIILASDLADVLLQLRERARVAAAGAPNPPRPDTRP